MRRADIILAKSKLIQQKQHSEQENCQQKCKRPKQSSSPQAANTSPEIDTVMISPIRDSVHPHAQADLNGKKWTFIV